MDPKVRTPTRVVKLTSLSMECGESDIRTLRHVSILDMQAAQDGDDVSPVRTSLGCDCERGGMAVGTAAQEPCEMKSARESRIYGMRKTNER
jgi:hypothetical protein